VFVVLLRPSVQLSLLTFTSVIDVQTPFDVDAVETALELELGLGCASS
jgi:hypothetical protein